MFWTRLALVAIILLALDAVPLWLKAQTNPNFQDSQVLCADNTSTQCPTPASIQPGLNQAFTSKMDVNPLTFVLTGPEPTTNAGQIGLGNNTVPASMCGSLPNVVGCWTVNINGTPRYIPYY
jgi:hypothetical protein